MDDKEKYLSALKKRALGFDYEEITTLIEETTHGTKKKIIKQKKYCPPDPSTAKYLLEQLKPKSEDIEVALQEYENELKEVANANKKD